MQQCVPQCVSLLHAGKWIYVTVSKATDWISLSPTSCYPFACLRVTAWMSDKQKHKSSIYAGVGRGECLFHSLPADAIVPWNNTPLFAHRGDHVCCCISIQSASHSERSSLAPVRQRHSLEVTSQGCPQARAVEGWRWWKWWGQGGCCGVVWCGIYLIQYVISCFSLLGTSEEIGIKLCYVLFSDTLQSLGKR